MDAKQTRLGIILALAAYFIWGIAPAYFKLIYYVPADEILTHRVIWSFFFMVALISVSRQWPQVKKLLKTPRKIFLLALSAVLVGGNWLLFIWAVNNHHMLEASLGYFINPQNKIMSSLLLTCGLPGGMMGSMMADLGGIQTSINNLRRKKGEKELSTDDLLVKLFDEVAYVWPRVGYPPLVTPFSQYTKNIALLNLLTLEQGKGRFVMMDDSMWGMILGRSGRVPGEIDPVLKEIAAQKGLEFTEADPHTLLPNALDDFRKEMADNGWDCGQDEEELFELAMHPEQYRNYKSGQAKKNFLADLQAAKDKEQGSTMSIEEATAFKHAKADAIVSPVKGQLFWDFQGDGEAAPATSWPPGANWWKCPLAWVANWWRSAPSRDPRYVRAT